MVAAGPRVKSLVRPGPIACAGGMAETGLGVRGDRSARQAEHAGLAAADSVPDEASDAVTFGIEEEFVFLDRRTLCTVDVGVVAVADLGEPGSSAVVREFFPSQIEFATPVCTRGAQALAALREFRGRLAAWADDADVLVAASGTPFRTVAEPATWQGRYAVIADDIAGLAPEHQLNGLHVHVGIPDRDAGVRASNCLRPWLPVLLALMRTAVPRELRSWGDEIAILFRRWWWTAALVLILSWLPPVPGVQASHALARQRFRSFSNERLPEAGCQVQAVRGDDEGEPGGSEEAGREDVCEPVVPEVHPGRPDCGSKGRGDGDRDDPGGQALLAKDEQVGDDACDDHSIESVTAGKRGGMLVGRDSVGEIRACSADEVLSRDRHQQRTDSGCCDEWGGGP